MCKSQMETSGENPAIIFNTVHRFLPKKVANGIGLAADELTKPCDGSIIPSLADCCSLWNVIFGSLPNDLDLSDVDKKNSVEEPKT